MRIFLIAGEPSGDRLGAQLIEALRALTPIEVAGVGGEAMAEQGVVSLFDTADLAIIGIFEAIPKIPLVWRRVHQTLEAAIAFAPDVVVTIDSPSFSLEVAERLRRRLPEIRLVHYAAPQVWAWKAWRAKAMARYLDHLLALLPFEPPFFQSQGLPTTFVGHPIAGETRDPAAGRAFRLAHGIGEQTPVLALLPGSRRGEITRLLPLFRETLGLLAGRYADLVVVVPTLPRLAETIQAAAAQWPLRAIIAVGEARRGLFEAADGALTASGTVTLELAAADLPMVVTYKVSPLTAWIARRVVRVQYAALPNLIMGREVVPEFIQDAATPRALASAVVRILEDTEARARQSADLGMALVRLGRGGEGPATRAARVVLAVASQDARRIAHV